MKKFLLLIVIFLTSHALAYDDSIKRHEWKVSEFNIGKAISTDDKIEATYQTGGFYFHSGEVCPIYLEGEATTTTMMVNDTAKLAASICYGGLIYKSLSITRDRVDLFKLFVDEVTVTIDGSTFRTASFMDVALKIHSHK